MTQEEQARIDYLERELNLTRRALGKILRGGMPLGYIMESGMTTATHPDDIDLLGAAFRSAAEVAP